MSYRTLLIGSLLATCVLSTHAPAQESVARLTSESDFEKTYNDFVQQIGDSGWRDGLRIPPKETFEAELVDLGRLTPEQKRLIVNRMLHIKGLDKDISAGSVQRYDTNLLDSVQAKLRDIDTTAESQKGAVLVEYYRSSRRDLVQQPDGSEKSDEVAHEYLAAVISRDTVGVRSIELHEGSRFAPRERESDEQIPFGKIERAVHDFRKEVAAAERDRHGQPGNRNSFESSLIRIKELLIDPLRLELDNIDQLILSPVADTWLVPFAAIPLKGIDERRGPKPYYLVEKAKVVYQVSARDIVREANGASRRKPLVFTRPDFNALVSVASASDVLLPVAFADLETDDPSTSAPPDAMLLACNQPGCTGCFTGWPNQYRPTNGCGVIVNRPYVPIPPRCAPWSPQPACGAPRVPHPLPSAPGGDGGLSGSSSRELLGECPLGQGKLFPRLDPRFTELGQRIAMSFYGRNVPLTSLTPAESLSFFPNAGATEQKLRDELSVSSAPAGIPQTARSAIAFCTHGFFCSAGPQDDPLMQCGLALAGANQTLQRRRSNIFVRRPNDGLLFGAEVTEMSLTGYEVAAIIACEGGVGTISGGSIASLRYAFLKAGAGSVFATIWSVDAKQSDRIARAIFDKLADDQPLESALHEVMKLEAETRTVHPYFWAPFTITGWRYQGT